MKILNLKNAQIREFLSTKHDVLEALTIKSF